MVVFGIVLSLILGAALYGLIRYGIPSLSGWYQARVKAAEEALKPQFSELFIRDISLAKIAHLVVLRIPLAVLVVYALTASWLFAGGVGVLAWFAPKSVFQFFKNRRADRFDEQLVDAVTVLSSSARAGLSLVQSIESVAEKMSPPASQEFGLLIQEYRHGTPIEQVLENARERLKRPNFTIVSTAIIVNREKGGNLVEVLDKINSSIREIFRLEKKIKTETASVRFSAKLMAFMPLVIGIIFYLIEPSSMELLFTDPVGTVILFFVIVLNVIALVIIRRIVNVEV